MCASQRDKVFQKIISVDGLLAPVAQRARQHPEAAALLTHARHRQRLETDKVFVILVVTIAVMAVEMCLSFTKEV